MSNLKLVSPAALLADDQPAENPSAKQDPAGDDPRDQAVAAARWAVAEYLRDVGLRQPELIARESHRLVARAQRESFDDPATCAPLAETAIQLTVQQLDQWLLALAGEPRVAAEASRLGSVLGVRLPELLSRYPEAWRRSRPSAEVVESSREDLTPVVPKPVPRPMRRQNLDLWPASWKKLRGNIARLLGWEPNRAYDFAPAETPSVALSRRTKTRGLLAILTISSTALATWQFCRVVGADGFSVIDFALTLLFAVLFLSVAFSFWMATLGLIVILHRLGGGPVNHETVPMARALPPTAILMPVYNEKPRNVFANIRAMVQSLQATGADEGFNFFVLSDTTEPDVWLEEERAWAKLVADLPGQIRVFYRHRPQNISHKAGNIAEFCSRWGAHYKYMIILDADSVMAGDTLVEMVRRMEGDPRMGILQVPPRPVNRQSFFARMQQFAAHMYSPVFLEGFVLWSECEGNYFGHNAILRVRPFMEHCALPILPGEGPLGGEILSHDFVEAALMRRAGWKVCVAPDLSGSFEECPTTVLDFARRDQRWCQGNLQHIRLLLAEGLHPASRLHLGMGAMAYLASPLWLTFVVLTVIGAFSAADLAATGQVPGGATLFTVTMCLLLLPKVWSVIAMDRQSRSRAGGLPRRALAGVLMETITSMLIAPILMLLHSRFVVSALMGRKVKWCAQQRDDYGVSLGDAFAVHYPHTLFGLVLGGVAWVWVPGLLPWLLPALTGLVLAIPLAMVLGSVRIGNLLARRGLLTIPEEVVPPPVLKYQRDALRDAAPESKNGSDRVDLFASVLADPAFYALHVGILRATESHVPIAPERLQEIEQLLLTNTIATAPAEVRRALLSNRQTMEKVHIFLRSHLPQPSSALLT